jgi:hypothetical protein
MESAGKTKKLEKKKGKAISKTEGLWKQMKN